MGRSRVRVNGHQFSPHDPLEVLRLLAGWANRAAIVSKGDRHARHREPAGRDAAVWAPCAAEAWAALTRDPVRQERLR